MDDDLPSDSPTFGDLLRRYRRARALTQEALAERAGVSVRAISDLERGARGHPYRETATLLAGALGLTGNEQSALLAAARHPLGHVQRAARMAPDPGWPSPLTRLIGRDTECQEIAALLRDERIRLLTLTGPGGVGKTRLAVAVATDLGDAFRDGVIFVDLAPLSEPAQVVPALAAALALTDQGAIPLLEAVRRRLRMRQMLLVLDNFEHLLPAAPLLSDLLQAAPAVQALVTSRAALRLHGEREYPVAPLRTPDPGMTASSASIAACDAIQLFVERAGARQPDFRLTADNAAAVAAICQRLDGLPLAIELAAARITLLPPATLLHRLEQRFLLLTAGARDAPPRQRTLQAAIAWSYDLLDPRAQTLLRWLAVFVGGWTLAAAETVGSRCGVPNALDALATLVEQNLVVRDGAAPDARFRLLETVRAYAREQLIVAEEENRAHHAQLHELLHLARENDLERLDAEVGTRLDRLNAEEVNLRAGIDWAIAHDPESALAVLAELDFFWFLTDRIGVGRGLHERVLQTDAGANPWARSRVLQQAAWLADAVGDFVALASLMEAAHALAEPLGDARTLAYVHMFQGDVAMAHGNASAAKPLLADALVQFEVRHDPWGLIVCLTALGLAAQDWGDPAAALAYFERVRAIVAERGLPALYQAHVLANLAYTFRQLERREEAFDAASKALRLARRAGRSSTFATAQSELCRLMLDRGDFAAAAAMAADFLPVLWEIGNNWDLTPALELAAAVLAAGGQAEPAARLFAAAASLREAMPYPIGAGERATLARWLAGVRAALGEATFTRAWTAGQTQPLEAIINEAQAMLASTSSTLRDFVQR